MNSTENHTKAWTPEGVDIPVDQPYRPNPATVPPIPKTIPLSPAISLALLASIGTFYVTQSEYKKIALNKTIKDQQVEIQAQQEETQRNKSLEKSLDDLTKQLQINLAQYNREIIIEGKVKTTNHANGTTTLVLDLPPIREIECPTTQIPDIKLSEELKTKKVISYKKDKTPNKYGFENE